MEPLRDLLKLHLFTDPLFDQNCYVLRRRDTELQAGARPRFLAGEGLDADRILLTHGHPDHLAGVPAMKAALGCTASIHPEDRWLLAEAGAFPGIPAGPPVA